MRNRPRSNGWRGGMLTHKFQILQICELPEGGGQCFEGFVTHKLLGRCAVVVVEIGRRGA